MYVDAVCMYDYAQFVCQSQLFKECKTWCAQGDKKQTVYT